MKPSAMLAVLACVALASCGEPDPASEVPEEGEIAEPPFAVRGEAEGLLLVWYDAEGLHTASRRSEIPEASRAMVRVDDLSLAPDERLDPELVYVADLRRAGSGGSYPVRRMRRASFDALVSRATADADAPAPEQARAPEQPARAPEPAAPDDGAEDAQPLPSSGRVVLYGASWCGACRSAAAFLRQRNIEFVERDIEREPGAREAMLRAARAAGVRPNGIPVIDFRGRIIQGFDRDALERAITDTQTPI